MHLDLAPFIKNLLYRYDCVILPGFGGFITSYQSAHFHPVTHTFFPPSKKMGFNSQLTLNDGLLATEISFHFKISQEAAQEKVAKYIEELRHAINSGSTFDLPEIGRFKLNEEGNIRFIPAEKVNFFTESFGMGSFRSPAILRPTETISVAEVKEKVKELPRAVGSRQWLRVAAVAVPLIALSAFGIWAKDPLANSYRQYSYLKLTTESAQMRYEERSKAMETEIEEDHFSFSNYYRAVEEVNEENATEPAEPLVEETPLEEKKSYEATGTMYHIIAGCFSIERNAENLVSDLRSKGFDANIVGTNPSGWQLVAFESYPTREEAEKALPAIQSQHNAQAWLLKK